MWMIIRYFVVQSDPHEDEASSSWGVADLSYIVPISDDFCGTI